MTIPPRGERQNQFLPSREGERHEKSPARFIARDTRAFAFRVRFSREPHTLPPPPPPAPVCVFPREYVNVSACIVHTRLTIGMTLRCVCGTRAVIPGVR